MPEEPRGTEDVALRNTKSGDRFCRRPAARRGSSDAARQWRGTVGDRRQFVRFWRHQCTHCLAGSTRSRCHRTSRKRLNRTVAADPVDSHRSRAARAGRTLSVQVRQRHAVAHAGIERGASPPVAQASRHHCTVDAGRSTRGTRRASHADAGSDRAGPRAGRNPGRRYTSRPGVLRQRLAVGRHG